MCGPITGSYVVGDYVEDFNLVDGIDIEGTYVEGENVQGEKDVWDYNDFDPNDLLSRLSQAASDVYDLERQLQNARDRRDSVVNRSTFVVLFADHANDDHPDIKAQKDALVAEYENILKTIAELELKLKAAREILDPLQKEYDAIQQRDREATENPYDPNSREGKIWEANRSYWESQRSSENSDLQIPYFPQEENFGPIELREEPLPSLPSFKSLFPPIEENPVFGSCLPLPK